MDSNKKPTQSMNTDGNNEEEGRRNGLNSDNDNVAEKMEIAVRDAATITTNY